MNKKEIKRRIREIKYFQSDDEKAHNCEGELYSDFILYVANTEGELAEMAKMVLKTKDIDFNRWCG